MKDLRIILQKGVKVYTREDVLLPEMPDGTLIKDYCDMLVKNTISIIQSAEGILPNLRRV